MRETADSVVPGDTKMQVLGWREWVSFPDLGLPAVKAKVDTGARTSALHAFDIQPDTGSGGDWVSFSVEPLQRNTNVVKRCRARVIDQRRVTDSGGHAEDRIFVETRVQIGELIRTIELTLTERHNMLFRMLLGRTALVPTILVDPGKSYCTGKLDARALYASIEEGVHQVGTSSGHAQ